MTTPELKSNAWLPWSLLAVVVVGAVGGALYLRSEWHKEKSNYIILLHDATLLNEDAFTDAIDVDKGNAVFRKSLKIRRTPNGQAEQPAGWEDTGTTGTIVLGPDMGQQVTQRVGFNNKANLDAALKQVK